MDTHGNSSPDFETMRLLDLLCDTDTERDCACLMRPETIHITTSTNAPEFPTTS